MERKSSVLDWVLSQTKKIAILCLTGMFLLLLIQLLLRNVFSMSVVWIDELSCFLHICMVFLAVPLLYKEDQMIEVSFFMERLPLLWKRIIGTAGIIISLIFAVSFLYSEISYMYTVGNIVTQALRMPNKFFFSGALVGMFLTAIVLLEKLLKSLRKERC